METPSTALKLATKQTRFVAEYLIHGNGSRAARAAGYSAHTAKAITTENLTKPAIQAAIQARQCETAQQLKIKRERVIAELQEAIRLARDQCDPGAMTAGWREIARICGFYVPEKPLQVSVNIAAKRTIQMLETLPDEELMRMAEGREQGS